MYTLTQPDPAGVKVTTMSLVLFPDVLPLKTGVVTLLITPL